MSIPDDNDTEQSESLSLVDLLLVMARHKKLMTILPGIVITLAVVYVILAPKIYESEVALMTPQQQQPTMAALGGLAGLAGGGGLGGAAGLLGLKNPNDMYVGLLGLPTMQRTIVNRFNLRKVYEVETMRAAVARLSKAVTPTAGKDNLIYITVEDRDPQRAADIANAYAEELQNMLNNAAVEEARPRRIYFEKLLKATRDNLTDAEIAMTKVQHSTGILDIDSQAHATIEAMAELRTEVAAKDVAIKAASTFATANNPDLRLLRAEKAALDNQMKQLSTGAYDKDDALVVKSQAPELAMAYLRQFREVKYQEALFEMFARMYESARVDESKAGAVVQVVEPAIPAEVKAKPKRALIVFAATVSSTFLAALLAFFKENAARAPQNDEAAAKWAELRSLLRRKRQTR